MSIEPIYDGNSNDTKIKKIMPLPSLCDRALDLSDIIETEQHSIVSREIHKYQQYHKLQVRQEKTSILKQNGPHRSNVKISELAKSKEWLSKAVLDE